MQVKHNYRQPGDKLYTGGIDRERHLDAMGDQVP